MATNKVTPNSRNLPSACKQSLLPPRSPFPSITPPYGDYSAPSGPKNLPKPREGHKHRQRTPSESFLLEEQPSWLDDLLNEPETPVRRGAHRRSSSDSFAYPEASSNSPSINIAPEDYRYKNTSTITSWGSSDFDHFQDVQHPSLYADEPSRQLSHSWEPSANSMACKSSSFSRDNIMLQNSRTSRALVEPDVLPSTATERRDQEERGHHDIKASSEKRECDKVVASETDLKRTKQQFAQRSRVRKLQYIAELERTVQVLQAEGSDISAELEFLGQQNLIMTMENKALKQRLDSLAQEQLIKHMEQEVLGREIARLRALVYQQQHQLQQPPPARHRRSGSRDLDSQFATLSLRPKEASSGREPVSGPLHI